MGAGIDAVIETWVAGSKYVECFGAAADEVGFFPDLIKPSRVAIIAPHQFFHLHPDPARDPDVHRVFCR